MVMGACAGGGRAGSVGRTGRAMKVKATSVEPETTEAVTKDFILRAPGTGGNTREQAGF